MKSIIDFYDEESKDRIENYPQVLSYRSSIDKVESSLSNLRLNTSVFDKLRHPIRTVRINFELKKIRATKNEFNDLMDSSLVMHMDEALGSLEEDLIAASRYYKPLHVKTFIEKNPIGPVKMLTREGK